MDVVKTTFPIEVNITLTDNARTLLAESQKYNGVVIKVTNETEQQDALDSVARITALEKNLESARKEITEPLDKFKKEAMDFFRPTQDFLGDAKKSIKQSLIAYDEQKRKEIEAEQKRLNEIAERERREQEEKARKAQAEADAKAEKIRLEAEAKAKELEAQGKADEAQKILVKAETKAEAVIEKGAEKAESALEMSQMVVAPVLEHKGLSGARENWSAECVDIQALCAAVAKDPKMAEYVLPNQKMLNQLAKALKKNFAVPGCVVKVEKGLAVKGKN